MSDKRALLLVGHIPGDLNAFKPYAPGRMRLHEPLAKAVEWVGDKIAKAADWVIDKVIDPVMTAVTGVIEAALDNPLKTILQIAAIVTPGMQWTLPLIEGADVAIKGGDLGDVLEATAKAYVMQEIGTYVGEAAGTFAGETVAGSSEAFKAAQLAAKEAGTLSAATVAASVVGSAARAGAVAVVSGQDPLKAMLTGGIGAAVPAVLGKVDGFTSLPPSAQRVIASAVSAQLSGGNVTTAVIGSAIAASDIVGKALKSFDPDGTKLDNAQRSILTDVLMGTATAALTGGSPTTAITAALMKVGSKALGEMATSAFKTSTTEATAAYGAASKTADKLDANQAAQKTAADNYNTTANTLQAKVNEQNRLSGVYNAAVAAHNANPSNETAAAANTAIKTYNDYVTQLNKDYAATYQPALVKYGAELDTLKQQGAVLSGDYETAIKAFTSKTDLLSEKLDPIYRTSNRAFVEAMNPEFNADEYKKANGLAVDQDPYEHFLGEGQFKGLPINAEQADRLGVKAPAEAVVSKTTTAVPADKIFDGRDYSTTVAAQQAAARMGMTYFTDKSGSTYKILTQDDVKSQIKSSATFGEAFSAARKSFGPGQNFEWTNPETGKTGTFTTQTKQEATAAANAGSLVKVDQQVIDYTVNKILPNITDYKNFNPADLTEKEYARFIGSYLNATDAQRQLMLNGADKSTYGVIANVLKEAPDMIKQGAKASTEPAVALGKMSASDYTNYSQVIKTAGNTAAADIAGLAVTGLIGLNKTFGYDTTTLKEIEKLLVEGKDKDMSTLVGNEKVIAGGLASGIESAAAWMLGGPVLSIASLGAITANNSWLEGSTAVIDKRGYSYKNVDEARKNGVFSYRALTTAENAQRTALMTSIEIAGEAVGVPGMSKIMQGIPIGGTAGEIANAVKNSVAGTGQEVLTEILTTTAQMAADKISSFGLGQNATWSDYQQAVQDTALATIVAVGTSGSMATVQSNLRTAAQVEAQDRDARATVTPITYNTVVAKTKDGTNVTFAELLTSQQIANLSDESTAKEFANLTPVIAPNTYVSFDGVDRIAMGDLFANSKAVADTSFLNDSSVAEVMRQQGFKPSDVAVSQFVGLPATPTALSAIKTYVAKNTFDLAEVKAAAKAEGYTITDAEAQKLVGQKDEVAAAAAARAEFDPKATTYDEAKGFLTAKGYTPTADEIKQFVGSTAETKAQADAAAYVNPRQVTFEEAKKYLVDQGYTKPSDADVKRFVGQVNEAEQAKSITAWVDPRVVDAGEVEAAYATLGLKKPTADDVQKLLGQYDETGLAAKAEASLPTARFNSIMAQLEEMGSGGISAEAKAAIDLVRTDLVKSMADTGLEVAKVALKVDTAKADLEKAITTATSGLATPADVDKAIAGIKFPAGISKEDVSFAIKTYMEANPGLSLADVASKIGEATKGLATTTELNTAISDALKTTEGRFDAVDKAIQDLRDAGLTADDVRATVDKIVGAAGTDETKATGIYAHIDGVNTKIDNINTLVGAPAEGDTPATGLYAKIAANEAAGMTRDAATQKAIADVAVDLGTTKEALLTQLGTTEGNLTRKIEGLETALTATEKSILDKVKEYEAAGKTREEATQLAITAVATDLGTTKEALLTALGTTETNLTKSITDLSTQVSDLSTKLGDVETNIYAKMAEYEKTGIGRDEALGKAIADVAVELGTTKEALLTQLGTTETNLKADVAAAETNLGAKITDSQEAILKELGLVKTGLSEEITASEAKTATKIGEVETNILSRVAEYEKAGIGRDEALNKAVDDVAANLGTTRTDILTQIGTTETNLKADIAKSEAALTAKIGGVETTLGRAQQQATPADLDAMIKLLEQQGAYDPQYDYNGDRIVDQNDRLAIENYLNRTPGTDIPFTPSAGTKWAPTGVFKTVAEEAAATRQAAADEAERTRVAAAADAEKTRQAQAAAALKTQRMGNLNTLTSMLGQAGDVGGQQVTVKAADPTKIGYVYDFSSIFANPSQEKMFASPFAQGGMVDGSDELNDELLKILKG